MLVPFWWEEWAEQMLFIMQYIVEQFIIRLCSYISKWKADASRYQTEGGINASNRPFQSVATQRATQCDIVYLQVY